jgi:ABC-type glutathione transport system ATPase component
MRQRVVLAMALSHRPILLVADEPTTGLDPVVRNELLDVLDRLRRQLGLAVLLISHDLAAVLRLADRLVVLDRGTVVEEGRAPTVAAVPTHHVTRRLLAAARVGGTGSFSCGPPPAASRTRPVLELREVSKTFGTGQRSVMAAEGVTLQVAHGEAVGLVGRSGAGKSTLARLACGLSAPDAGSVRLEGRDPAAAGRGRAHLVFQDPYEALPPSLRVADIVAEPLVIARACPPRERGERARAALVEVALEPGRFAHRYPHELSGGERQRVALARAIVARPALVVADEPAAMLDAALAAELVELVAALRSRHGMAWLLITHELGLAARVCDRLVVLGDGRVVDDGPAARVLSAPAGAEAAALVAASQERAVGV